MKKNILYILPMMLLALALTSCDKDEIKSESIITVDSYTQNSFDKWLEANYVKPYNIAFKYRYEEIESDLNYYTVPAQMDNAVMMAHLVKYLCIETYDEVAGIDFTRQNFPKEFFLIGTWEFRNNGTYILGTAEGGKKILLAGINYLDQYLSTGDVAYNLNHFYIKTIHHEFTHILNQTKDYSTDFQTVTGSGYVSDSWSTHPYDGYDTDADARAGKTNNAYLLRGFISAYAQMEHKEDFAEMVAEYVTHDEAWWQEQLAKANGTYDDTQTAKGNVLLENKLEIVRDYLKVSWGIDIDELRSTILRRQGNILSGLVDLTDLTVE